MRTYAIHAGWLAVAILMTSGCESPAPPPVAVPSAEPVVQPDTSGLPQPDRVANAEELGIELNPLVAWYGRSSEFRPDLPWLNLGVTMQGGAAAHAWQFGGLQCRVILDDEGTELAVQEERNREYLRLATRETGPSDGVEALASFVQPDPVPESLAKVEGSLLLLLGSETKRIRIEGFTARAGVHRDPALKAVGIEQVEIEYEPFPEASPPYARVSVLVPRGPIAGVGLSNATGEQLERTPMALGFRENNIYSYSFIYPGIPKEDDVLWIDVVTDSELVEVPFSFENLELPEMP